MKNMVNHMKGGSEPHIHTADDKDALHQTEFAGIVPIKTKRNV